MIATVKCYKDTGLNPGNCLDSPSKLDSLGFDSVSCPDVAILQDRGVFVIRVNASYSQIGTVDYAKINNNCYWVTGIRMLNENVAELTLQSDALTSIGLSNLDIISGWCTRRCVTDDTLFSNTIDEPFSPSEELTVDFGSVIKRGSGASARDILVACAELSELQTPESIFYQNETPTKATPGSPTEIDYSLGVFVPKIGTLSRFTQYRMTLGGVSYSAPVPATSAYYLYNDNVLENLARIRALGLDSVIGYAYHIPEEYMQNDPDSDGWFQYLSCSEQTITSSLSATFGSYKNNKVYTGQFQSVVLMSIVSGDRAEYKVEEIIASDNTLKYQVTADLRYNGSPVAYPYFYYGKRNQQAVGAIQGAQWSTSPIIWTGSSGSAEAAAGRAYAVGMGKMTTQLGFVSSGLTAGIGLATASASGASTAGLAAAGTGASAGMGMGGGILNYVKDVYNPSSAMQMSRTLSKPEIQFAAIPSLQNYLGNNFYDYRYRLSDADMVRFDNFLTQFGYAVNEPLTGACFTGRQNFNYVKAEGVNVNANYPAYLRNEIITQIESGVRVWHTRPSLSAMTNNPIG